MQKFIVITAKPEVPMRRVYYAHYLSCNGRVLGFNQAITEAQARRLFKWHGKLRRVETPTQIFLNANYLAPARGVRFEPAKVAITLDY